MASPLWWVYNIEVSGASESSSVFPLLQAALVADEDSNLIIGSSCAGLVAGKFLLLAFFQCCDPAACIWLSELSATTARGTL